MKKIILFLLMGVSLGLNAQNLIISDDSTFTGTSNNALLEVYSAGGNKGILIPRLTTTQRTSISTTGVDEGLVVYDTDTHSFWVWDGTQWTELSDKQTLTFNNSTGELTISNGNSVTIPLSSGGDNWGSQVVQTDGTTLSGNGTSANPLSVVGDLTDDQQLSLSGNTLSLTDGGSVDLSSFMDNTDNQQLHISGHSLSIDNGNTVTLPDNDNQTLGLSGNTLSITNGNSVDLSGINTDAQTLSLSGNTLSISGGNSVNLSQFMDNTDDQNLHISGHTLSIDNGNSVTIPDNQTLSISGNNLSISNGNTVDLSSINTDAQTLSLSGNTLSISGGNSVDLSQFMDNTDDQNIQGCSVSGNNLIIGIENGNSQTVDLSHFMDNTDNQQLSISGHTISLTNGGSVTVPDNDNQTLSLSGNTLSISGGNSVDLSSYLDNTDNQTLTLSGNTLSISGGNSVDISSAAWSLSGNSISNGQFLGTTNNKNLIIRTNNTDRWIILRTNGYLGYGYDSTSISFPVSVTDGSASRVGSFVSTETSSDNYAVYGECANTDFWGYGGYFTGGYVGLEAEVNPSGSYSYYGARAYVSGGSGSNYAIYGSSYNGQSGYGLYGYSSYASDYGYGTYGTSLGADSGNFGGYFVAYDAYPRAIYGSVTNDTGFGGYFSNFGDNSTGLVALGNGVSTFYYPTNGGGLAATGKKIGVFGYGTDAGDNSWGGYFSATGNSNQYAYVSGQYSGTAYKINGTGSVSTIVKRPDGSRANMFAPEAPEILFQDFGEAKLVNGRAHINLDPIFAKNIVVNKKHPLRVFIQLEGDCKGVYVTNKTKNGFDVVELQGGTSNVKFSWFVTANRADDYDENGNRISKNADVRFPDGPAPMPTKSKKADKPRLPKPDPKTKKTEKP